ncbi:uncharacterized protein [Dermacentor albipictus]|uniref:uncharacterized protein isoform X2 n=1 Tax=Dermacentor albipictus TaxID=60249 RepID=UPI0038FCCCBC
MPMSKLNDIPQEYLQYMVDIMHKEGHHYFFHDVTQYNERQAVIGPDKLFVGFTIRIFFYNKDQSGHAKLAAYWSSRENGWQIAAEVRDKSIRYAGKTSLEPLEYKSAHISLPDDAVYSLAIRVIEEDTLEALVNEEGLYKLERRNVIGYKCYFHIEADGLLLLGMSIASETVPRAANLWGRRCCLWNLKMPVGTVGVYTCALVDNTKENWIELTHANGSKTSHHFSHAKLPNGTLLHYTIRISFTEYIVSTDFDKTVVPQESETPNYINAFFSEALNIINFDVDVPST